MNKLIQLMARGNCQTAATNRTQSQMGILSQVERAYQFAQAATERRTQTAPPQPTSTGSKKLRALSSF